MSGGGVASSNNNPNGSQQPVKDVVDQAEIDEGDDVFVEVTVSDPQKMGEGISSFMAYRVTTTKHFRYRKNSNANGGSTSSVTVTRRFSDFLGMHEKLVEKHAPLGRIIPPAPEKNLVGTTKAKFSSSSAVTGAASSAVQPQNGNALDDTNPANQTAEFINRRKMALERFTNRVVSHPILREDCDVIEFLESKRELPRATSTSALSSASVLRLLGKVGDTVTKISAVKMEETDPWYDEKVHQIDSMEAQLRKLYGVAENLVQCRHDLAVSTGAFAQATAAMSNTEEAHTLSKALSQLSKVEENVEQVHYRQAEADFNYFFELTKDYVALIGAVKDALNERTKAFQAWQHAQSMVMKKKEQRARLEMGGKTDKLPAANEEVLEWENRLEESQANFNKISMVIKSEVTLFERYRVRDFKAAIVQYMEALMTCQLQLVKHWEDFLPEIKTTLY